MKSPARKGRVGIHAQTIMMGPRKRAGGFRGIRHVTRTFMAKTNPPSGRAYMIHLRLWRTRPLRAGLLFWRGPPDRGCSVNPSSSAPSLLRRLGYLDRRVRSDCATLQDPGKPPAPAMHDPKEFGPPFDADIRKRE